MSKTNLRAKRAPSAGHHRDPAFAAFDEDTVLCELNADFKRSKRELIHRFLSDQEELNRRFAEYELNSDDENSKAKAQGQGQSEMGAEEVDLVAQLELPVCRSSGSECDSNVADNLSTVSAVHTSSIESIPDVADLEDEETQQSRQAARQRPRVVGTYFTHDLAGSPGNTSQTWPKGPSQTSDTRRPKKLLVKKNVRPRTAMGIRFPLNMDEDSDDQQESFPVEKDELVDRVSRDSSLHHSVNLPHNRNRRKFSWLNDKSFEDESSSNRVPSEARLSSARVLRSATSRDSCGLVNSRHYLSSSTSACTSNSYVPLTIGTRALRTPTYEIGMAQELDRPPSQALSHRSLRSDATSAAHAAAATRLTMNVIAPSGGLSRPRGKSQTSLRHGDDTAAFTSGGYTPSAGPSVRKSKRHIALLKLPPLDGATVMSSKGPLVDGQPVISPAAKGSTVPPATESLAG